MATETDKLEALKGAITDTNEAFYKGWLYGEFGTRKTTTLIRCALPGTKVVLLHADRGWQVIHNHKEEFSNRVIPVRYEGLSQVRALVEACVSNTPPFDNVSLIGWDTVSQGQEEYIDFLLDVTKFTKEYREKAVIKNKDIARAKAQGFTDQEVPGMPDYHLAKNQFRPVVRELVLAPIDVIFVAHVRKPSVMNPDDILRRPSVTEALYDLISRECTFIGYTHRDKNKNFAVQFEPTNKFAAKSQIPSLQNKTIPANELPQHLWDWKKEVA